LNARHYTAAPPIGEPPFVSRTAQAHHILSGKGRSHFVRQGKMVAFGSRPATPCAGIHRRGELPARHLARRHVCL